MKLKLTGLLLMVFLFTNCAKIYYSPDVYTKANSHQLVAMVPSKISIAAQKKVSAEAMEEQKKTESLNFQKELYSWLLRRKMQNRVSVELQDVATTNAKLIRVGYPEKPLSPGEICEVLGVDGLITSSFSLSKPMSEGAAVALGVLFGVWGSTNDATVSLEIYDGADQSLLWNYNHRISGTIGSSPAQLVNILMRKASRKMPYTKEAQY